MIIRLLAMKLTQVIVGKSGECMYKHDVYKHSYIAIHLSSDFLSVYFKQELRKVV